MAWTPTPRPTVPTPTVMAEPVWLTRTLNPFTIWGVPTEAVIAVPITATLIAPPAETVKGAPPETVNTTPLTKTSILGEFQSSKSVGRVLR